MSTDVALTDLEPEWLAWIDGKSHRRMQPGSLKHADGIIFLCPKCYQIAHGSIGVHSVICWFEGHVPDTAVPGPGRWTPKGTGFHDLTFVPGVKVGAVSVQLLGGGCAWHGFIRDGRAIV